MEEQFIGRHDELERLEKVWKSNRFEFVVIYGRRRVGKSFLIDAFREGKKGIYFEAVEHGTEMTELRLMSRAVSAGLYENEGLGYQDFISIFDDIAKKAMNERIYFAIDEISYLCEACTEMVGLLQHYVDVVFKHTKLVLILSGSSRRFIEENILSQESPLYDRRTEQIKLFPFTAAETARMFPSWNVGDLAIAHAITGGIPYYLRFLARHDSIEQALHDEFFLPGSSLFTEAELFMKGIYRSVSTYDAVLMLLASGNNEVSKIGSKTGLSDANVSMALSSLSAQGIVSKKVKIEGRGIGKGWEIRDGYFAFHYRYVQPYYSMIERGRGEAAFRNAFDSLSVFVSKRIEQDFRDYVFDKSGLLISTIGSIDFPNPVLKRNEEVDLFGKASDCWIIGECKWQTGRVGTDVLNLLEMRKMILAGEEKAEYFILSKSGFSEALESLKDSRPDVHLISADELFGR